MRKYFFYIGAFLIALLSNNMVKGQSNIDTLFKDIDTEKVQFSISYGTRFYNDDGSLKNVVDVLNIVDSVLTVRVAKYNQEELAEILLNLLEGSPKYDWIANLLLYYIMQESAIPMYSYRPDKIKEWRDDRKEKDILFWKQVLER